jgi:hypothetical protein
MSRMFDKFAGMNNDKKCIVAYKIMKIKGRG